MRRREFITTLCGTAVTQLLRPLAARAQQPPMPVVGILDTANAALPFRKGLYETGYLEGRWRSSCARRSNTVS